MTKKSIVYKVTKKAASMIHDKTPKVISRIKTICKSIKGDIHQAIEDAKETK